MSAKTSAQSVFDDIVYGLYLVVRDRLPKWKMILFTHLGINLITDREITLLALHSIRSKEFNDFTLRLKISQPFVFDLQDQAYHKLKTL